MGGTILKCEGKTMEELRNQVDKVIADAEFHGLVEEERSDIRYDGEKQVFKQIIAIHT